MRFNYNGKEYEVLEMTELGGYERVGMCALFEVQYVDYIGGVRINITKEQYEVNGGNEELRFVNYFYQDNDEEETIKENAIYFIEHEYDKRFSELKYLMRELRKVQYAFELDDDYYLERLDDKQYDLYEWVLKNIELTQDEKDLIEWNYKYGETR